jgi:Zn-dependent protease/CBS domain-containing protein
MNLKFRTFRGYLMNGNIRVGNLFGIPFYVNPSWFFVLGLVTLSYGGQLALFPQLGGITPWILGFVAALLLFASVVAHELGHSFVAIAQGIKVKSISLFIFGGLASLEKESDTPLQAFSVAIAGPLVSLLLFGLFTILGNSLTLSPPLEAIIYLLASINLILGLFNLIPGLPLDGGNILKALVWQITGNPNKGIIFASRVGQFFGWLGIIVGGLSILGYTQFGSFWTLLIGFFLLQNAGFSAQSARVNETLSQYTAQDAVIPNSPIVSDQLTLREFVNNYVIGQNKWTQFLVTNEVGQLLGTIAVDELKTIPTSNWTEIKVSEVVKPVKALETIPATQSLLEVVKLLEQKNLQQLTVVGENGVVVGLLEKASVINFLQQQAQAKAA